MVSIYCINLVERNDKNKKMKTLFERLNLEVEFYRPNKNETSGRIGCFESHINVIKKSITNNDEYVIIFEDDIIDTPAYDSSKIDEILMFMKDNTWCEYFQLGYTILPHEFSNFILSKKITKNIIKYNGNCTHAYVLSKKGMINAIENWEKQAYDNKADLDIYYKDKFQNNGASYCPILFDQNFCLKSDNETATSSYYSFMRKLSCNIHKISFLYFLSLIKSYLFFIFFVVLLLILSIVAIYRKNASKNFSFLRKKRLK